MNLFAMQPVTNGGLSRKTTARKAQELKFNENMFLPQRHQANPFLNLQNVLSAQQESDNERRFRKRPNRGQNERLSDWEGPQPGSYRFQNSPDRRDQSPKKSSEPILEELLQRMTRMQTKNQELSSQLRRVKYDYLNYKNQTPSREEIQELRDEIWELRLHVDGIVKESRDKFKGMAKVKQEKEERKESQRSTPEWRINSKAELRERQRQRSRPRSRSRIRSVEKETEEKENQNWARVEKFLVNIEHQVKKINEKLVGIEQKINEDKESSEDEDDLDELQKQIYGPDKPSIPQPQPQSKSQNQPLTLFALPQPQPQPQKSLFSPSNPLFNQAPKSPNYKYIPECEILFLDSLQKFKKDEGNLLQGMEITVQCDFQKKANWIHVKTGESKISKASGLLVKGKSMMKSFGGKGENVMVSVFVANGAREFERHIFKLQFNSKVRADIFMHLVKQMIE